MQVSEPQAAAPARVQARAGFALELSWALHAARWPRVRAKFPVLDDRLSAGPLVERVLGFWDTEDCFSELLVLAHAAGALGEEDPDALLAALEAVLPEAPTGLALRSEEPATRDEINDRLARLRRSAPLRRDWLALMGALSAAVAGDWAAVGRPLARAAAEGLEAQLARGVPWTDLVSSTCHQFVAHRGDLEREVAAGHPLLLGPSHYFGQALYLDLPGLILLGVDAGAGDRGGRARTEALARRLKVLADPTRLALLDYLGPRPGTVGELARAFGLSQPTVSSHVKVLREAGLVRAERQGTRQLLSADPGALAEVARSLGQVVPVAQSEADSASRPARSSGPRA
jgi:DNA-binding transcriptional ArsR family regulator